MNANWQQVLTESRAGGDPLYLAAGMRLLRVPGALRLLHLAMPHNPRIPPRLRPSTAFAMDLVRRLFAEGAGEHMVWASILVPAELLWGLGLTPFYPEAAAAAVGSLGLTARSLAKAAAAGCPQDICTFHRSELGLSRDELFPAGAAYVASSSLCNVAGLMFAAEARRVNRPFVLLDVPPEADSDAVDYVEAQLRELVATLERATGVRYVPDRMREAIRRSNRAREMALEFHELRRHRPAPVSGGQMSTSMALMAWLLGHEDGVAHFREWRDYAAGRIAEGTPEQPLQKVRLYWLHLSMNGDSGLQKHLQDNLGAVIAFEEYSAIWWDPLDEDRPLRSLANRLVMMPNNGPVERRVAAILDGVNRYRCDAVIHHSHWGCRQSAGAVRVIRDRLRREGIPLLDVDGDCLDPTNVQPGPLRTRIEAFVETLA